MATDRISNGRINQTRPKGTKTDKPCAFFNSLRGCVKGDACNFLHSGNMMKPGAIPPMGMRGTQRGQQFPGFLPGNGSPFQLQLQRELMLRRQLQIQQQFEIQRHQLLLRQRMMSGSRMMHPKFGGVIDKSKKMCSYFNTHRGCVKGDACDFLHPGHPKKNPSSVKNDSFSSSSVCRFFNQPRGCAKGNACKFLHEPFKKKSISHEDPENEGEIDSIREEDSKPIREEKQTITEEHISSQSEGQEPTKSEQFKSTNTDVIKKQRPCSYFNTPRGCAKGDACDFQHISGSKPGVSSLEPVEKKNRVCDFFNTMRGCVKGESCDFLHILSNESSQNQAMMGFGSGPNLGMEMMDGFGNAAFGRNPYAQTTSTNSELTQMGSQMSSNHSPGEFLSQMTPQVTSQMSPQSIDLLRQQNNQQGGYGMGFLYQQGQQNGQWSDSQSGGSIPNIEDHMARDLSGISTPVSADNSLVSRSDNQRRHRYRPY